MGIVEDWASFWSRVTTGGLELSTFPFTEQYLKAWCNVQQKYPRLSALNPYGRAFVDATCPRIGFPNPPEPPNYPPFPNGQCEGIRYLVRLSIWRQFQDNPPQTFIAGPLDIYGPITSIAIEDDPSIPTQFLNAVVRGFDVAGQPDSRSTPIGGVGFVGQIQDYFIERDDGLPDDCYDPRPNYPDDPPLDVNDFRPVIIIPNADDLGVPLPDIQVPIHITLDLDLELNWNIQIGDNNYEFNFEGFNGIDPPSTVELPVAPMPDDLEEVPVPEEEEEIPGILWARVIVTQLPTRGVRRMNPEGGDVDHFAGFFSWIISEGGNQFRMEEIAIRKTQYMFRAPEGATGVRYYAVNGAILSVSVFKRQEE